MPNKARPVPAREEPVSRRTIISRIVLGLVAVALLAGMVVQFTPNLGGGAQGPQQTDGKTVMTVNGAPVTERELERLKQGSQIFNLGLDGVAGQDLENLLVDQAILITAARQDAARVQVSNGDVRKFITDFRNSQQITSDADYLARIQGFGYTDASFREAVRQQLQLNKRIEEITSGVKPTDAELKFYQELNPQNYRNEPRIEARQIVVSDRKAADDAKARLDKGDEFAAVAKAISKELADQDGALGAKKGEKTPQPITKIALPSKVAEAAFKLEQGGTTGIIEDGGKFYILKVEKFLPGGPQSFEEAKTRLTDDVKASKANQAIEDWVTELQKKAKVVFPKDSPFKQVYNPVVAKVGSREIKLAELNRQVYFNPQVAQFIQQGGGQGGTLVQQFFKPQALENLVNQAVALNAARAVGKPFVGAAADVLGQIQQYQTRNVTVTDAEIRKYYNDNIAQYTTPASAVLTDGTFTTADAARAFRSSFVAGGGKDFIKAASAAKGTANEAGNVTPDTIDAAYKKPVFEAPALTKVGDGQVSEVIEKGEGKDKKFHVLWVTNLVEKKVKPFEEVKADAQEKALGIKRSAEGQKWLEGARKSATVVNNLSAVSKELETRAAKADASRFTITSPVDGAQLDTQDFVMYGTGRPDQELEVVQNGKSLTKLKVGADGQWSYYVSKPAAGDYNFEVRPTADPTQAKSFKVNVASGRKEAANAKCPCVMRVEAKAPNATIRLLKDGKEISSAAGPVHLFRDLGEGKYVVKVEAPNYATYESPADKFSAPANKNIVVFLNKAAQQ
jgi:parvulin-like peptidyl-prolyl isomerase